MRPTLKSRSVNAYIAAAPKELRGRLRELRAIIRAAAPAAEECISYGMPYYAYKGRVAYFQLAQAHIGLYIPSPVLEEHKALLKNYHTTKATLRLPLDKKLPVGLIKQLIRARIRRNEEREKPGKGR